MEVQTDGPGEVRLGRRGGIDLSPPTPGKSRRLYRALFGDRSSDRRFENVDELRAELALSQGEPGSAR